MRVSELLWRVRSSTWPLCIHCSQVNKPRWPLDSRFIHPVAGCLRSVVVGAAGGWCRLKGRDQLILFYVRVCVHARVCVCPVLHACTRMCLACMCICAHAVSAKTPPAALSKKWRHYFPEHAHHTRPDISHIFHHTSRLKAQIKRSWCCKMPWKLESPLLVRNFDVNVVWPVERERKKIFFLDQFKSRQNGRCC